MYWLTKGLKQILFQKTASIPGQFFCFWNKVIRLDFVISLSPSFKSIASPFGEFIPTLREGPRGRIFYRNLFFMKNLFFFLAFSFSLGCQAQKSIYDYQATDIDGNTIDFAKFKGKKLLIVNTASECGYTPQYEELEKLYEQYKEKDFVIIGFPCNDFGAQEPGTEKEIAAFCQKNYGVSFPMMSKISVKGSDKHPLYQFLTQKELNGVEDSEVKWNFHKFLVDEKGRLVKNLPSKTSPLSKEITSWIGE